MDLEKCWLHSMDIAKALERVQHRSTDTDNEDIRELMNSCLQERHEQLQDVDRQQEMTKRGKRKSEFAQA